MKRPSIFLISLTAILLLSVVSAHAASPYVSYQGILHDEMANPLNGSHTLTFRIYATASSDGVLWAETQTVQVTDGLFNVLLGSGTGFTLEMLDTDQLWMSIQIGSEQELYPRVQLTSVFWAGRAAVADSLAYGEFGDGHSLDADDGLPVDALYVDLEGKVGIGTTSPAEDLQVVGTTQTDGFKMPTGATLGWVLTSDASGQASWQPAGGVGGDGDWTFTGADDMHATPAGNVGIGTTSPGAKLDIRDGSRALRVIGDGGRAAIEARHTLSGNLAYLADSYAGVHGVSELLVGVFGESDSVAVVGENSGTLRTSGYLGGVQGAYGESAVGNYGYLGGASFAVYGAETTNGNYGGIGYWNYGVLGDTESQVGVMGRANGGTGVAGLATTGWAVYGTHSSTGNYGYIGGRDYALFAESPEGTAVLGLSLAGTAAHFIGDVLIQSGDLTTPVLEITGGSDLSEGFEITSTASGIEPVPGMLVCVDPSSPGELMVSRDAYDTKVAGVISGAGGVRPGLLMGQKGSVASGRSPVALTGRVYCMADASNGPIAPGDLLTTSDVAGHAMKARDRDRSHGAVIGKAMTALESGRGLVLVLVSLQ